MPSMYVCVSGLARGRIQGAGIFVPDLPRECRFSFVSVYACVCAHGSRLRVRDRHTLALAIVLVLAGRRYMRWHCRGAALVSWRCGGAACARCLSANSRPCSTLAQCMLRCDSPDPHFICDAPDDSRLCSTLAQCMLRCAAFLVRICDASDPHL